MFVVPFFYFSLRVNESSMAIIKAALPIKIVSKRFSRALMPEYRSAQTAS